MRAFLLSVWMMLLTAAGAWAVDPSEMLNDPALEARARALDAEIRCVKCQSEVVASSHAAWAKDARRVIRELIAGGSSDAEVRAWFQARYGDYVLMNPPRRGLNWVLWLAGPVLLGLGLLAAFATLRARSQASAEAGLSAEEAARLERLLQEDEGA